MMSDKDETSREFAVNAIAQLQAEAERLGLFIVVIATAHPKHGARIGEVGICPSDKTVPIPGVAHLLRAVADGITATCECPACAARRKASAAARACEGGSN